jgi:F0F1-type ATP synthase assembly protein I
VAGEMKPPPVVIWGRRALVLVMAGLALQIAATFAWAPGTFVVSAAVGLPLVLLGAAIFAWAVWRSHERGERP